MPASRHGRCPPQGPAVDPRSGRGRCPPQGRAVAVARTRRTEPNLAGPSPARPRRPHMPSGRAGAGRESVAARLTGQGRARRGGRLGSARRGPPRPGDASARRRRRQRQQGGGRVAAAGTRRCCPAFPCPPPALPPPPPAPPPPLPRSGARLSRPLRAGRKGWEPPPAAPGRPPPHAARPAAGSPPRGDVSAAAAGITGAPSAPAPDGGCCPRRGGFRLGQQRPRPPPRLRAASPGRDDFKAPGGLDPLQVGRWAERCGRGRRDRGRPGDGAAAPRRARGLAAGARASAAGLGRPDPARGAAGRRPVPPGGAGRGPTPCPPAGERSRSGAGGGARSRLPTSGRSRSAKFGGWSLGRAVRPAESGRAALAPQRESFRACLRHRAPPTAPAGRQQAERCAVGGGRRPSGAGTAGRWRALAAPSAGCRRERGGGPGSARARPPLPRGAERPRPVVPPWRGAGSPWQRPADGCHWLRRCHKLREPPRGGCCPGAPVRQRAAGSGRRRGLRGSRWRPGDVGSPARPAQGAALPSCALGCPSRACPACPVLERERLPLEYEESLFLTCRCEERASQRRFSSGRDGLCRGAIIKPFPNLLSGVTLTLRGFLVFIKVSSSD